MDHDLYSVNYNNADVFLPFDLSEENSNLPIYERDPDINFYAGVNTSVGNNCKYYMEDDFNSSWPGVAYMRHEKQLPFP